MQIWTFELMQVRLLLPLRVFKNEGDKYSDKFWI
jgi:hypothetical protein